MLVAKDPKFDDRAEIEYQRVQSAGIEPHLKVLVDVHGDSGELELAFASLFERALESGAKVVRVEVEQVFVYGIGLLLCSNEECHQSLEVLALLVSVNKL